MTTSDLTDIIAAVGPTVFSYLPLGSLINGNASPLLVNKIFHGAILEYLRAADLCFSCAPHLRKINDEQLICLVQTILGKFNYMKTKRLDLSRCRKLKGDGVIYCLKNMPNLESISLSSAARFDVTEDFKASTLETKSLQSVDVSGCTRLGTQEISCIVSKLSVGTIRTLDLSFCSTLIGDDAAVSVARCPLECVNVSGSKKITTFGVAIIAFVRRRTLRCLSLRGCTSVKLSVLLYNHALALGTELMSWRESGHDYLSLLRQMTGSDDNAFLTPSYAEALANSLLPLAYGQINSRSQEESNRVIGRCKEYERQWASRYGWETTDETPLFGRLENLDLSHTNLNYMGDDSRALAMISWLNKGQIRQLALTCGSRDVISALALASGSRLQCLEMSYNGRLDRPMESLALFTLRGVSELDLSCCDTFINHTTTFQEMESLRCLKLDHLPIKDHNLEPFLLTTKRLLRLSVHGCTSLKMSVLQNAKSQNSDLNLLDLDARDVSMDIPLSRIRDSFPDLLKLNNRCTKRGTSMILQHQRNYHWRIGARERYCGGPSKRKRGEHVNMNQNSAVGANSSLDCCSILSTGFSKADCTEQEMFGCKTCLIEFGRFVCLHCATICHKSLGHEVHSVGYGPGYCDCSILSDCMCIEQHLL